MAEVADEILVKTCGKGTGTLTPLVKRTGLLTVLTHQK